MTKNAVSLTILHTHTHTHTKKKRNTLGKSFLELNNKERGLSSVFSKPEKAGLFYLNAQRTTQSAERKDELL